MPLPLLLIAPVAVGVAAATGVSIPVLIVSIIGSVTAGAGAISTAWYAVTKLSKSKAKAHEESLKTQHEMTAASISEAKKYLAELPAKLKQVTQALQDSGQSTTQLHAACAELTHISDLLHDAITSVSEDTLHTLDTQRLRSKKMVATYQQSVDAMNSLLTQLTEKEAVLDQLIQSNTTLQQQVNTLHNELTQAEQHLTEVIQDNQGLKQQVDTLEPLVVKQSQQLRFFVSTSSRDKSLNGASETPSVSLK